MTAIPLLAAATLAGLCLGSFAATAALRAARGEQAIAGRSRCDRCGERLSYSRTIPIVSFIQLGGACDGCGAKIDPLHLVGELAGGAVAVCAFAVAPPLRALLLTVLGLLLLASALYDAKTRRLPDAWTLALALLAVCLSALRSVEALMAGLIAAALTLALLMGVRWSFRRLRHREGLGLGDVKLLAALALWLGAATPWAIAAASILALAYMALLRRGRDILPFGPAIACGAGLIGLLQEGGAWPTALP